MNHRSAGYQSYLLWGYFLKLVLADRIGIFVDSVYADIQTYGGWFAVVAALLYGVQIYCDFAGYTSIALGIGCIASATYTENPICWKA